MTSLLSCLFFPFLGSEESVKTFTGQTDAIEVMGVLRKVKDGFKG